MEKETPGRDGLEKKVSRGYAEMGMGVRAKKGRREEKKRRKSKKNA